VGDWDAAGAAGGEAVRPDPGMWEAVVPDEGVEADVHVVPRFPGERVHVQSSLCWCKPSHLGTIKGNEAWSHHRRAEA
jgi:hypothetical protein